VLDQAFDHRAWHGPNLWSGTTSGSSPSTRRIGSTASSATSLTDEPLVNWAPPSLAALDARLGERCAALSEEHDRIRSLALFHWWPTLEAGID
jgi:hypothetical protein